MIHRTLVAAAFAAAALAAPASAAQPVVGGAAAFASSAAPGLPDAADPQFRVPAGLVEHRVWTRTVTGANAAPADERQELWLSAARSRLVVTDAGSGRVLREVTESPTESRIYDAETGELRISRHARRAPSYRASSYEAALHRAYVAQGVMRVAGERTVAGRRALVLESVPGHWQSDEPGGRTVAVVDAESYDVRELTSSVPDLFTQTVTTRTVERLRTGSTVNAKLRMRRHAGATVVRTGRR